MSGPDDDKTLKEVMAALKLMRTEGADLQFEIDQLQEMFAYFRSEFVPGSVKIIIAHES